MIQRYAIAQRLQVEFDQLNENQSEASNRSCGSSLSDSSLDENRNRFKRVFDMNKGVGDTNLKLLDVKFIIILGKRLGRVL
jgi:hypothetical protein